MEFAHIKKTKNGVEEEMIEINYTDARYPNSSDVMFLSLKDANDMARGLTNFVAEIPY